MIDLWLLASQAGRRHGSPVLTAAFSNSCGEMIKSLNGIVPVDAGIGDGLAAGEFGKIWLELLVAFDEIGFDHHGGDGFRACGDLVGDVFRDQRLVTVVFVRVAV
jgi:hypothetical protein